MALDESHTDPLTQLWGEFSEMVSGIELAQWRSQAQEAAIALAIPATEVDWLLTHLSELDRLALRVGVSAQADVRLRLPFTRLQQLWQQRVEQRIPLQYLVGLAPWREFWLRVTPDVLIPRPETELLIDLAKMAATANHATQGSWADLGTGSGAIALGLATALPQAQIFAVDYSAAALAIAQSNAATYHLHHRIHFYQGEWLTPLAHLQGQLQGIVSNPPYIPHALVPTLAPEVAQHEPHLALDGGEDGLESVRHLITTAPDYLKPGGIWLVELMVGQAPMVANLLEQQGNYAHIQIHADLSGIPRFVLAQRS